jgi:hypothetical protein
MLFATIYWFVDAHKWFKGPKVNIEHKMLGRPGNVIQGESADGKSDDDSIGKTDMKTDIKI